jgi:hypothetical protein
VHLTVYITFEAFTRWTTEIKRSVAVPAFRRQEFRKIMGRRPSYATRLFRRGADFVKQLQVFRRKLQARRRHQTFQLFHRGSARNRRHHARPCDDPG